MRSRKHSAWKKNRKFGDVHGGRNWPKITDKVINRAHSLKAPGPDQELPMLIDQNPGKDYYFPLSMDESLQALRALPPEDIAGITHLWFRRLRHPKHPRAQLFAEYICGSGVHLITIYPWPKNRRLKFGRIPPTKQWVQHYAKFSGQVVNEAGWFFIEFEAAGLRKHCLHTLYEFVGFHVSRQRSNWSKARTRRIDHESSSYAARFRDIARNVLSNLEA